jgi:hypothetical protein
LEEALTLTEQLSGSYFKQCGGRDVPIAIGFCVLSTDLDNKHDTICQERNQQVGSVTKDIVSVAMCVQV